MEIIHYHFATLETTSGYALEHCDQFDKSKVTLITADHQTAGRGRLGRSWSSQPCENILASFVFFIEQEIEVQWLGLLLALAAAELMEFHGVSARFKWPNDLIVRGHKIAGVLVESKGSAWIVGIGLNVNMMPSDLAKVGQPATSLYVEVGKRFDLAALIAKLSEIYLAKVERFLKEGVGTFADELSVWTK